MESDQELFTEESSENIDTYFEGEPAKKDEGHNAEGIEPFPFDDLIKEAIQNEREQYAEFYRSY